MKKGFALIELIIALALTGALVCTELTVVTRYMKVFKDNTEESRDSFYVNEAFAFLEYIVDEAVYVEVKDNIIKLERRDGTGFDWVRTDEQGDLLISYGSCYFSNTNNIMKNVKSFEAKEVGRIIFISITTKKEKVYNKCIYINTEKAKMDLFWCIHY